MAAKSPLFELVEKAMRHYDHENKYYAKIGRFIVAYASAETAVHLIGRRLSGLNDDKARVLFAGMRIGDIVSRIRGLLATSRRGKKSISDISDCLRQFDIIGTQRDKMVHRSLDIYDDAITVTNMMTAKSILNYERENFTIDDLNYLTMDCLSITIRLHTYIAPQKIKAARDKFRAVHAGPREPWRYKPPQPNTQPKRTRRRRQKQVPQPQS